jgi:hypothetical protein
MATHPSCSNALPVSLIGTNAKIMCQYIEFIVDLLVSLGNDKVYNSTEPIRFMDMILLDFESVPSQDLGELSDDALLVCYSAHPDVLRYSVASDTP